MARLLIPITLAFGPSASFAADGDDGSAATAAAGSEGESVSKCEAGDATTKPDDPCFKDLFKQCQDQSKAAGESLCKTKQKGGEVLGNTVAVQSSLSSAAASLLAAAETCNSNASKCDKSCKDDKIKVCQDQLQKMAESLKTNAGLATQSASDFGKTADAMSGSKDQHTNATNTTPEKGGGGMGGMAGMLGPAAAIGAAMMKQQQDKDKEDDSALYAGAIQKNGTVMCDRADSGMYSNCDSYLQAACLQSIQSGAFAGSATCGNFAQRFCTGGNGLGAAAPAVATTLFGQSTSTTATASTMPELGVQGAGASTTFCKSAIAYNYCAGGTHSMCPSCQNLGNLLSVSCQANPQSCQAQSSDATLAQARTSCPDDPMFSSGAPMIAGSPAPNAGFGVGGITTLGSNPTVVTTPSGIVTTLPQSARAPTAAAGGSAPTKTVIQPNSVGTPGPASDIGAEYGPSLSNITGHTIKGLCDSEQLNCR